MRSKKQGLLCNNLLLVDLRGLLIGMAVACGVFVHPVFLFLDYPATTRNFAFGPARYIEHDNGP